MNEARKQIVVVGAGLAGLTAAYELAKTARFDVLLLEARSQIGGRVASVQVRGTAVDLGGFLIFPWYRNYHGLTAELGLDGELRNVPAQLAVYFDLGDRRPIHENDLRLRSSSLLSTLVKSIPSALTSGSLDHPRLDHFQRKTVEECIEMWASDPEVRVRILRLIDTICQGYCYPPIAEYKAAFAMPIYPRTVLLGGATRSDMFRHGSRSLPQALVGAIEALGGEVRLGCEATGFVGRVLHTTSGDYAADGFVLAQNADHPLLRDFIPPHIPSIRYTRFATAVVRFAGPYQPELVDWGAIFFAPNNAQTSPQVLSIIDLERLYENQALRHHYTVNIRLPSGARGDASLVAAALGKVREDPAEAAEVVAVETWDQAMPVSSELLVETVRALQGIDGCYFAGDYLGCPSMEVAVSTGLTVAERIQRDLG